MIAFLVYKFSASRPPAVDAAAPGGAVTKGKDSVCSGVCQAWTSKWLYDNVCRAGDGLLQPSRPFLTSLM